MENLKKENIVNPEISKIEQKIKNIEELKGRIREMYEGGEIPEEALEFITKLNQMIEGYSSQNK